MDFSTNGAWSNTIVSAAPDPRVAASCGSLSRTACDSATALPSGASVIEMPRLSLPLVRVIDVAGAGACSTAATSPRRAPETRSSRTSSKVDSLPPTWTLRLLSASVSVPAGIEIPLERSASGIAVGATFAAASFAWSGVMVMFCLRAPVTAASRTPAIACSSGTTVLVTWSASSRWSVSELTASTTAGRLSVLPAITCGSTPCGSCARMRVNACWRSFTTSATGRPKSNCTCTVAEPSREVEVTSVTPATPRTAVSIGLATCSSTSSGLAPGNGATTTAAGNSNEGSSSCLSDGIA